MSWAEDMGYDGYEPEVSDSEEYEWEDGKHSIRLISDLETFHIENIIRNLEAGKSYYSQEHKLDYLKKELKKRKAQYGLYKGVGMKAQDIVLKASEELQGTIDIEKLYEYLLPKAKELAVPLEYVEWLIYSTAHKIILEKETK